MGIFKNITKALKKAAPLIGSTIGFAFGGPAGAAIGSGIGSLAAGRSAEEALLNAGMAYGVGSFAKGADFGKGTGTGIERLLPSYKGDAAFGFGTMAPANEYAGLTSSGGTPIAVKTVDTGGIGNFFKDNMGKIALGGAALSALSGLSEGEKEKNLIQQPPFPKGETRLGYGRIGNKQYNLDDEEELKQYFVDNRNRDRNRDVFINPMVAAAGGEVEGPGTGTSDSVPARLSDGEFVVTAKAVRGAGNGDRNVGAARMYDMMSQLERVA